MARAILSPEEPPPRTRTTTLPLWARETILGAIYSKPEISYYIIRIRVLELCTRTLFLYFGKDWYADGEALYAVL